MNSEYPPIGLAEKEPRSMTSLARLILITVNTLTIACQSQANKQNYTFEINKTKISSKDLPWAFQQARYELEYAKRVSEKQLINQSLGDAVLLAIGGGRSKEEVEAELFPVPKPSSDELRTFHQQMNRFLPPDFAANQDLIGAAYVKWKTAQLKNQYLKAQLEQGRIAIKDPDFPAPRFSIKLPMLPKKGPARESSLAILVVSVRDCEVCLEREVYLKKVLDTHEDSRAWQLETIDVYPGDTSLENYQWHRQLLCAGKTADYWPVRKLVFQNPPAKDLSVQIGKTIREDSQTVFRACLDSNEPEQLNARNLRLAAELYSRNLFSIYMNQEKIAFPTEQIIRDRFESLAPPLKK